MKAAALPPVESATTPPVVSRADTLCVTVLKIFVVARALSANRAACPRAMSCRKRIVASTVRPTPTASRTTDTGETSLEETR